AVADFGNGKADYVAAALSDGLRYASGKGDGTFGLPTSLTGSVDCAIGVWTANLNGDGKPDLVAADNTGHVYTILNNGLTGSISGTVFVDANHNGIQDLGEAGKANWWVYVDANNNQVLDFNEVYALTDANGAYTLSGLPAGTYKVRERVYSYAGWSQTTPLNGFGLNVTLGTHEDISNKNFGIVETDYLVGTVFNDANGNGIKDASELGLAGRTVYLDANNNAVLDAGEKTATTSV